MKRIAFTILAGLVGVSLLVACDEDKKKAEILAKTAPADAAPPELPPSVTASSAPSASASPEPPKREALCPTGSELTLTDKDLEAELRLKLSKPKDPLKVSDLANVRSLNLTKKQSLDELDP